MKTQDTEEGILPNEISFNVPSKTTPGKKYNVFWDDHKEQFACECKHFSLFPYNLDRPCNHINRVIEMIRRKRTKK